jgi:hypothetical protein
MTGMVPAMKMTVAGVAQNAQLFVMHKEFTAA